MKVPLMVVSFERFAPVCWGQTDILPEGKHGLAHTLGTTNRGNRRNTAVREGRASPAYLISIASHP